MRQSSTPFTRNLTVLAVGFAALACGDITGVDPEDLAGTWRAVTAVATNAADRTETADLVEAGVTITFIVEANGRVESVIEFPGLVDTDIGTLTVTDGEFVLTFDGAVSTGTIKRRFDVLELDILTGIEWDFGDDGLDEPATLYLAMQRDQT